MVAYEEASGSHFILHLMSVILFHDAYLLEHVRLESVNSRAVEHLLGWEDDECDRIFEDLHSVIRVRRFGRHELGISFYHKSFLDYLLDSGRWFASADVVCGQLTISAIDHVLASKVSHRKSLPNILFNLTFNLQRQAQRCL